jgi:hypothetical protein
MNTPDHTLKQIALEVQDQNRTPYQVHFTIDEAAASGELAILTAADEVARRFELTRVKKGHDGTQLTCTVRGATTTLTLDNSKNPPELRVVATLLFPIFSATYYFSQTEHQRFVQWINTLAIGTPV